MKKALAIILSVMMLMSTLVACGSKTDDSGDANNDAAASYPTKNVNVIVPFSAGGNTDMSMRALLNVATSLDSKYTFVVDNKTGNAGLIGMEALAEADPDGYTLGTTNIDLLLHICFGRTDVTMDNYIPIAATMADPYVLVISASNPNYSNLEEFVEYAKANPGVVKMADSGVGAAPTLPPRRLRSILTSPSISIPMTALPSVSPLLRPTKWMLPSCSPRPLPPLSRPVPCP